MKTFNKWMVVPYEEKIISSEDKDLTNLKDILADKTLDDGEKYNNYNNIFKRFVDKKSTIPEKKEIVNPKVLNSEGANVNFERTNLTKINRHQTELAKLKQTLGRKVQQFGNEGRNVKQTIEEISDANDYNKSEIEKVYNIVKQLLKNRSTEDIMNSHINPDEVNSDEYDSDESSEIILPQLNETVVSDLSINNTMRRPIAYSTRLRKKRKQLGDPYPIPIKKNKKTTIKEPSKQLNANVPQQLTSTNTINWQNYKG